MIPFELAVHRLALRLNRLPCELDAMPGDEVMRAIAIEGAEAKWANRAAEARDAG